MLAPRATLGSSRWPKAKAAITQQLVLVNERHFRGQPTSRRNLFRRARTGCAPAAARRSVETSVRHQPVAFTKYMPIKCGRKRALFTQTLAFLRKSGRERITVYEIWSLTTTRRNVRHDRPP
jgi:hypothetical protein